MENRIERLENLVSLQDDHIEKLNDALYEQQKQLDSLQRFVERMAGKIREIDNALDQAGPLDTPPPHYNG